MPVLQYRIVTNWPASMKEDFVFAPTSDRAAHYNLLVEVLACIADEKDPAAFRISEETFYEYDIQAPREPVIPCMPTQVGDSEADIQFAELCGRMALTGNPVLAESGPASRAMHVIATESYVIQGAEMLEMALLAKRDRAEAKFRFVMGKFGIDADDVRTAGYKAAVAPQTDTLSLVSLDALPKSKKAEKRAKKLTKLAKMAKKSKKDSKDEKGSKDKKSKKKKGKKKK